MKLGDYHIIPHLNQYSVRHVPCYETGRYHRHKTHEEKYTTALCGKEVVRGRDESCSVGIADPNWDKDWCPACLSEAPWGDKAATILKKRGLLPQGWTTAHITRQYDKCRHCGFYAEVVPSTLYVASYGDDGTKLSDEFLSTDGWPGNDIRTAVAWIRNTVRQHELAAH